ncbi:hypothetical protein [Antrihabitans stalactiti]|uniref:hypothetical protein n=1 Tax=Antrihabitans stalactiti TaxID=2584121 RepID=UPI001F0EED5D|nr:hypothetical protein [Antrihabitans stalactiti]
MGDGRVASDSGDLLVGIGSAHLVGRAGAIKAVAVVAPWVAAGVAGLARRDGTTPIYRAS